MKIFIDVETTGGRAVFEKIKTTSPQFRETFGKQMACIPILCRHCSKGVDEQRGFYIQIGTEYTFCSLECVEKYSKRSEEHRAPTTLPVEIHTKYFDAGVKILEKESLRHSSLGEVGRVYLQSLLGDIRDGKLVIYKKEK